MTIQEHTQGDTAEMRLIKGYYKRLVAESNPDLYYNFDGEREIKREIFRVKFNNDELAFSNTKTIGTA